MDEVADEMVAGQSRHGHVRGGVQTKLPQDIRLNRGLVNPTSGTGTEIQERNYKYAKKNGDTETKKEIEKREGNIKVKLQGRRYRNEDSKTKIQKEKETEKDQPKKKSPNLDVLFSIFSEPISVGAGCASRS